MHGEATENNFTVIYTARRSVKETEGGILPAVSRNCRIYHDQIGLQLRFK